MIRMKTIALAFLFCCFGVALFVAVPIAGVGEYNPWADINDDGHINAKDAVILGTIFGSSGAPLEKASLAYDSGWIDITDKCGQNIVITHNMNSTDLFVDIQGKADLDSGPHQKHYGLTSLTSGWSKTFGGADEEAAQSLVRTDDGGYALAGLTASFGAGSYDAWLVKTDASGNMQWSKTYGGTDTDVGGKVIQTDDGGYAIASLTYSFGAGDRDSWLVKTDASGNMQWNNTYGGTENDVAFSVVQTGDGGYALAGYTQSFGAGYTDFWLVKTDASGNMQWSKTYGGTDGEVGGKVIQTDDGGYVLAGNTGAGGDLDFWLVKTDAAGNMQWNNTYGGTDNESNPALLQTSDGGYALAGSTTSYGAGSADFWLVKTDVESGLAWVDSSANTITLCRGVTDVYWNFVRVRLWKPR